MEEATTDSPSNPETKDEAIERYRRELEATYYKNDDPRVKYSEDSYRLLLKAYKELKEVHSLRHLEALRALNIYSKVYETALEGAPEEATAKMWRGKKRNETSFFKILPPPEAEEAPHVEATITEKRGDKLKAVAISAEGNIGEALSALSNFFKE